MFIIKAVLPDGTTDIYETGQLTISADRKSVEFMNIAWPDDGGTGIRVGKDNHEHIYIENSAGKTVEALHNSEPR